MLTINYGWVSIISHWYDSSCNYKNYVMAKAEKKDSKEKDPCWKGYEQKGMKTKEGKKVPNCVKK